MVNTIKYNKYDDMVKILKRALRVIPRNQFWINPDCGLKTRGWEETKESMKNMVSAREEMLKVLV